MIEPVRYEIPFIMPSKEKLESLNPELYKLNKLIEFHSQEIEQLMYDYLKEKKGEKSMICWRKWFPLIFRFKTLLLMHQEDMTLRDTEQVIKENISVRLFLDLEEIETPSPSHVIIHEWNQEFEEDFIKRLNQKIVIQTGKKKKLLLWRRSRTDTTVVEENVSYPTDSNLLKKWKDLLIRWAKKVEKLLWTEIKKNKKKVIAWVREMKKRYYNVKKYVRKRWEEARNQIKQEYSKLLKISKDTIQASKDLMKEVKLRSKRTSQKIKQELKKELEKMEKICEKYEKVIQQTTKRVIDWEMVPMKEKLISYFSDSATIICKWKENKSREIWQKLSITEVENGIITNWEVYEWNPNDTTLLDISLKECKKSIWKIPKNNAFDRWYWDKQEKERIEQENNIHLHIPKHWRKSEADKQRESTSVFKKYQRFRSWWEGRISLLKRRGGLRRLRVRWAKSTKNKIWWWILTDNMRIVA